MEDIYVQPAKLVRLRTNLRAYDLDDEMANYECLGKINSDGLDSRLTESVALGKLTERDLVKQDECICQTPIKTNCFIKHLEHEYILRIGVCCYKALTNREDRKKICSSDDCNNRHMNRITPYCNSCKVKCKACNVYHDDNTRCIKCESCDNIVSAELAPTCRNCKFDECKRLGEEIFGFGKTWNNHKLSEIKLDYISWVRKEKIDNPKVLRLLKYHCLKTQFPENRFI